jgi:hypothetical protein
MLPGNVPGSRSRAGYTLVSMPPVRPPEDESSWQRRIVCAEVNGRRVNEAIERGRGDRQHGTFVCECGRVGCTEKLDLTIEEYEAVRASFERFLIAPGHEVAGIDRVTEDHEDYLVAVKQGTAADVAEDTDARGDRP